MVEGFAKTADEGPHQKHKYELVSLETSADGGTSMKLKYVESTKAQ